MERSVRKLLEGLNMFDGTHLTLISDVGQDKKMFGSHERALLIPNLSMCRTLLKELSPILQLILT